MTESRSSAWMNSLGFRLMAFLLVALLPIGLIAVMQTRAVSSQAERNAELALVALTEQASRDVKFRLERAFTAAKSIGAVSPAFREDVDACTSYLGDFIDSTPEFSFAGFLPPSGKLTCSSAGKPYDFSEFPNFSERIENPTPQVSVNRTAPLSGESVIIVSQPVFENSAFVGYVTISIPHSGIETSEGQLPSEGLAALVTLNSDGEVLTSSEAIEKTSAELPELSNLADLLARPTGTFVADNALGIRRLYAIETIVSDQVHVLGVWEADTGIAKHSVLRMPPSVFPLLMWFASLVVCIFAIHRLVIRHIRSLGSEMRQFAKDRALPDTSEYDEMPAELRDMAADFRDMAQILMQDEATLEDSVRAEKILLKEVHHRVKNNLQLISSILNMQIRKTGDEETRIALRSVQERVLSLATIHRDLYQSDTKGLVNGGKLLREIVSHSMRVAGEEERPIELETHIDDVMLVPDQAVPLSLLAAEATTNALKYIGAKDGETPWFRVSLSLTDDGICDVVFENSSGNTSAESGTGLGSQLIKAFAIQLGAEVETSDSDDVFIVSANFNVISKTNAVLDF